MKLISRDVEAMLKKHNVDAYFMILPQEDAQYMLGNGGAKYDAWAHGLADTLATLKFCICHGRPKATLAEVAALLDADEPAPPRSEMN